MTEKTNEELVSLIQRATDPDDRRGYLTMLYKQNYPFMLQICKKYIGYEEIEDLMQEAFFGLCIAAERYEPTADSSFINFASYWIRAAVRRYLDNCSSIVRLPVNLKNQIIKYQTVLKEYRLKYGKDPLDEELCILLRMDKSQLQKIKAGEKMIQTASLDSVISSEDDSFTLGDTISDPSDDYEEISNLMDAEILRKTLWSEVKKLNDDQAEIIQDRFKYDMTLKEIAEKKNLSPEGVKYILARAYNRLRRSERIKAYADDYYMSQAYHGTGQRVFRQSGTSSTEKVAIDNYERSLQAFIRKIERERKRIEKKLGIVLEDEYLNMKIEQYKSAKNE